MTDQSMRGFISVLEQRGELHRVKRLVDPRFELGAVMALKDRGPGLLFEKVGAADAMPVVGNLLATRERFAQALGVEHEELDAKLWQALAHPIKPVLVNAAPVQQVVHADNIDLAGLLPVPTWFERETAPYITAGVIIAKDPETGRRNVSIARLRLEGGGRIMAGIAKNHHLYILAEKAKALGRKLEIAVAIGNHTAVLLGSQLYLGLGDDEYDTVGGLLGEALQLVRCKTVDLEVPAHAEIVLEGHLDPEALIDEGPVSEFHGFYVNYGPGMGGSIHCVTHRRDAIYQAILPGYAAEHCLLGGVAIGATLCQALQRMIPAVRRVVITEGGMGRLHAVISMHQPRLGEGARAVMLAMGHVNLLKLVIVVEDDVDPENWREVEWSLAARFRGGEDLIVVPHVKADRCDPVHENLTVTKIGMVATTRPGDGETDTRSEWARAPLSLLNRVRDDLSNY
ncbi:MULTISPECIES: UbiD family decarboxylase [unclassified Beijerinckia]|uniref:UbiD family decarboxylase n=1 Tax=unclassified Beijerinckia TaxID=2638183 RepID=UPI0008999476|nr:MULTISPECIES: UbiD family decarboxylase [unclassified Beijerinckia]MDH7798954.1 2,5-furandicarboxylate decarboxylase 1 [Beijerinckia sp. GAS462]SED86026.1 UbiD family decarboxylase [Beijerinckia sp. 28-YEA-48]